MTNIKNIIEQKLKAVGVEYRFIPLPEDLPPDIASHMAFHRSTMEHAMATIVYRTEKGLVAAIKRADTQIDQEKLKKLAGVKTLSFATKEDLIELGVEVGVVPYVGLDIQYYLDSKVIPVGAAYGTTGIKTLGMVMESHDIAKVNHAQIGDFTSFEKSKELLKTGKRRLLSGITPSGDGSLHIGNYLGAVHQFIELAKTQECFLMVADLHALTTIQDKKTLQHNVETLIINELALLGDLTNITFFRQSDVVQHTELQSVLNNVTPLGFIKRAHAYKDKLEKDVQEDDINMGLFNYPILMASDILLYKPDLVPVGRDQKQHIEITRDIAGRFNKTYPTPLKLRGASKSGIFKLPEPYIPEEVAVVMGTDGKRKMSKSLGNVISIFDTEETIRKQVMGTYTDPTRIHKNDPGHIEGNMVFTYLDFFAEKTVVEPLKKRYQGGSVGDVEVKNILFETLLTYFGPARKRYDELRQNPSRVKHILEEGAKKARGVAAKTMDEVRDALGLTNMYSFFKY